MPWEIFERKVQRSSEPTVSISKLGRIGFNRATTKILADAQAQQVLLLWDAESHRFGVKPIAKRDRRAYTIHYGKDQAWSGFAAKTFLEHVKYDYGKTSSFPCEWDEQERILIVQLPRGTNDRERSTRLARAAPRSSTGGSAAMKVNATA